MNPPPGRRFPITTIQEGLVRFRFPISNKDIHIVPNRDQYQDLLGGGKKCNLHKVWYTKQELDTIQYENKRLLRGYQRKTIRNKQQNGDDGFCLRGLERQTSGGSNRSLMNRLSCLHMVLQEQNRQWQYGIHDPHLLATVTSSTTHHTQKEATMIGIDDATFVATTIDQQQGCNVSISSDRQRQEEHCLLIGEGRGSEEDDDDETTTTNNLNCPFVLNQLLHWFTRKRPGRNQQHQPATTADAVVTLL